MKRLWIYLLLLLFAFLQTTIAPYNVVLLLVISWAVIRPFATALRFAFIAGIVLDFLAGTLIGETALIFLGVMVLFSLFRRNVWATHFIALAVFVFVVEMILPFVIGEPLLIARSGIEAALILGIKPMISFIDGEFQGERPIQLDFRDKLS